MDNMYCFECVYKHLAAALSYGKEVLSGHGKGADLDHRIDFLGEIINAEHHIQLINDSLYRDISNFRKTLQAKKIQIDSDDLQIIRDYFSRAQEIEQNGTESDTQYRDFVSENPDILYYSVNNADYFKMSYDLLHKNLFNYGKIFVLKSAVDLSAYTDVQVLNQSLDEFLEMADDFILMQENHGFLREFNAKQMINTYSTKRVNKQTIEYLKNKGVQQRILNFDDSKPQLIKVDGMKKISDYKGCFPITAYSYVNNEKTVFSDDKLTANCNKKICCGLLQKLKTVPFVTWDHNGFESLKNFVQTKK